MRKTDIAFALFPVSAASSFGSSNGRRWKPGIHHSLEQAGRNRCTPCLYPSTLRPSFLIPYQELIPFSIRQPNITRQKHGMRIFREYPRLFFRESLSFFSFFFFSQLSIVTWVICSTPLSCVCFVCVCSVFERSTEGGFLIVADTPFWNIYMCCKCIVSGHILLSYVMDADIVGKSWLSICLFDWL